MKFNKSITIQDKVLSPNSRTFIIAEAGVNHGGDIEIAKKLVDIAADAGADAVKFQAFRTKDLIINNVEKAPYQKNTTSLSESQTEMLTKLELRKEQYLELKSYCESQNIIFLITPFDESSLTELEDVGVVAYKVASTDTTNLPFLKKIARTGKPIFLSTGMTYFQEIKVALQEISAINRNVILMQCTANYPIANNEANLNVIKTFQNEFDILCGFSDHSVGIGAAPYAIPMGVCMIEKHFTISKEDNGPDHSASLNPIELKNLVEEVRRIEEYMGNYDKKPTESENNTRKSLQKCLVAKTDIKRNQVLSDENVVAKRTGGKGISPMEYKSVFGTKAIMDFKINDIIEI